MRRWVLVLIGVLSVAGCARREASAPGMQLEMSRTAEGGAPAPAAAPPSGEASSGADQSVAGMAHAAALQLPAERKIIRNGDLRLEVASVDDAVVAVKEQVAAAGGYISDENVSQADVSGRSGSITCRIPAAKLDSTVGSLRALGLVQSMTIRANDITEQYFDLEIRVANQKKLETELNLLLQRPANRLSELLEIEREVARVRTGIEELEGRKRLWDNQLAYSTLIVYLTEPRPAIASGSGGAWRALGRSFKQAGENFVYTLAGMIAASGALIPIGAMLLLFIWVTGRLWRWRKSRLQQPR